MTATNGFFNWNRLSGKLILCLAAIAIASTTMTLAQSDDDPVLMYVQFESSSEIPETCQDELGMPSKVLSGQNISTDICGDDFFDKCNDVLDYIFRLEYTTEERNFVKQMLEAVTIAGSQYICSRSQDNIDQIMSNGGSLCLSKSATAINYCSYVSIVRFDTSQPLESICKTLDYAFDCNMKAIDGCNLFALNNLWNLYYRAIIVDSPCNKFSKFGNIYPIYSAASHNTNSGYIISIMALVSLYAVGVLQRII